MQTPWCCRQNSIPCCHNSIQALARVYSCLSSERQWDKVIVISSLPNLVHWLKCVAEFRLCQLNIPSQLNITLNNFAAFLSQLTGWSSSPRIMVGILKTSNTVGPERAQNVPSLYPLPPPFLLQVFLRTPIICHVTHTAFVDYATVELQRSGQRNIRPWKAILL